MPRVTQSRERLARGAKAPLLLGHVVPTLALCTQLLRAGRPSGMLPSAASAMSPAVAPCLYGVVRRCGGSRDGGPLSSGEPHVNIFAGNLAFTTTEQDLRQLFEPYGTVETIRMMTDRETGRSRGFGFVEMPDSRAAQRAIDALNGTQVAGRALTVNQARPREPRREPRQPRW